MEYRVDLPAFSGPLDLLLHLVKRQEVDVHEIQISQILKDYLAYLKALETLDLNNIGEFLVMASTLMEVKSKELLPKETLDLQDELDPRDELITQLLEYRRYRELTRRLEGKGKDREQIFSRGSQGADQKELSSLAKERFEQEIEESLDLQDLDAWFLVKAYAQLLEETDFGKTYQVEKDEKPMRAFLDELRGKLEARKQIPFRHAFNPEEGKMGMIGTFMAMLELMKQGEMNATQDVPFSEILLIWIPPEERRPMFDDEPAREVEPIEATDAPTETPAEAPSDANEPALEQERDASAD